MIYRLGIQGRRIVDNLRRQILSGELPPGTKLPPHDVLAADFGVAPLTLRHALAVLEGEGWVSRQQGRGTFVRMASRGHVLIVDDDVEALGLLDRLVSAMGITAQTAKKPKEALKLLSDRMEFGLIISDVRMPKAADGIEFIRFVRRRWPSLALAALTGYPDDLASLHGTPECPILILAKPVYPEHLEHAVNLAFGQRQTQS